VMTGVLTWLWLGRIRTSQSSFEVVVLASDIDEGTALTAEHIATARFPESSRDQFGKTVVGADPASQAAIVGKTVSRYLPKDSLLLYEYLQTDPQGELSSRLTPGKRALTIPVNAPATVGYFVEPGSLVDILGTVVEPVATEQPTVLGGEMRVTTKTLQQKVRVLAVGGARTPEEYRRVAQSGYSTVTVELEPAEAERLVFAMQQTQGGLTLLLRNPNDQAIVETPSVNWSNWLQGK